MFSKIATNLCKTTVARRSLSAQASPETQNGIRHETGLNFELNDEAREIIDLAEKGRQGRFFNFECTLP